MLRKNFGIIFVLATLALPFAAQASDYDMDKNGSESGLTIPVTAYVMGEADVFDSRSCQTDHPP